MNPQEIRVKLAQQSQQVEDFVEYLTTGKQSDISTIPFRTIDSFNLDQRNAMDKLRHFSPYYSRLEKITTTISQMATKIMFVQNHLVYFDNNELNEYNKVRKRYHDSFPVAGFGVLATFGLTFFYQLVTKAATRPAFKPALKASLCAGIVGFAYLRYQKHLHDKEINRYFLQITNQKLQKPQK